MWCRRGAGKFPGALRTYRSGSLATGLVNRPVSYGDSGVVLDPPDVPRPRARRSEGRAVAIVEEMQAFLGPRLRAVYPKAY